MALLKRPVILLQTLAANALDPKGSSEMTVLRPMLEISRNCSFSDTKLLQRFSTIVSTWYSLTLFTNGPKLKQTYNFKNQTSVKFLFENVSVFVKKFWKIIYHFTARFCTSPFLSSNNFNNILTTFLSESSSSLMLSFCNSVIKSFVAINLKSLSLDVI